MDEHVVRTGIPPLDELIEGSVYSWSFHESRKGVQGFHVPASSQTADGTIWGTASICLVGSGRHWKVGRGDAYRLAIHR